MDRSSQKNLACREPGHTGTAAVMGLATWGLEQMRRRIVELK